MKKKKRKKYYPKNEKNWQAFSRTVFKALYTHKKKNVKNILF